MGSRKRVPPNKTKKTKQCSDDDSPYYFDEAAADKVCEFFRGYVKHQVGEWAGQNVDLDEWQIKILRDVFGWKRKADGLRRYTTLYLEVPRKNGKSLLGSGLALYLLACDDEPGAEIYSAATEKKQARICFKTAVGIVKGHKSLEKRIEVTNSTSTMNLKKNPLAFYTAISAEAYTKDGLNAHGIIFDELHAQPNRDLYDVLRTSCAARRQPLEVYITTAGKDINTICWEVHQYALDVKEGRIQDDSFYGAIFAADKDDDWTCPKTWAKANPGFGVSVKVAYLERKCQEAISKPSYENTFKRNHLNIWTEAKSVWIPDRKWRLCGRDYGFDAAQGFPIYIAADLSKRIDITAVAWSWWFEERVLRQLCMCFMPEEVAKEREKEDRVPYALWAKQGYLILTPGDVIDSNYIYDYIDSFSGGHEVKQIGLDPWNGTNIMSRFMSVGAPIVEVRQGFPTMSPFMKDFEELVRTQQIQHNKNPLLNWMMSSVVVKTDPQENIKPDKSGNSKRIDGAVASIMSAGLALKDRPEESVYEHRGVLSF
ncbi:MAG TPA: terminase TerL endonuclease subunit [Chroococcales cyanobacterium]